MRELDEQRQALGGDLVGQAREAGDQPVVSLLVVPEEVLDACTPGGDLDALRDLVGREDVEDLLQRLVAADELTTSGERLSQRQHQLDALLRRCRLRQHPQRRGQPSRGRRGCLRASFLGRLAEHRDGSRIAVASRTLDVVCACTCWGASLGKGRGDALMRTDAPASGGGLVDRAAHDRVTEPEPTWHVGVSDELDPGELVDRLEHVGLAQPGGCASEIDLERIARHRGAVEHTASRRREKRQFLGQRGGDHRGDLHSREGHLAACGA